MTEQLPARPGCGVCGTRLVCHDCDDLRPTAEDLYGGWRLLSPFSRWETVTKTEHSAGGARVLVWTKESGARPWVYWYRTKVTAHAPEQHLHGRPEVRVTEHDFAGGLIYAFACLDTDQRSYIDTTGVLVQATFVGRGKGWNVTHLPTDPATGDEGGQIVTNFPTKAKARSELIRVARQLAHEYGVPLNIRPKDSR